MGSIHKEGEVEPSLISIIQWCFSSAPTFVKVLLVFFGYQIMNIKEKNLKFKKLSQHLNLRIILFSSSYLFIYFLSL